MQWTIGNAEKSVLINEKNTAKSDIHETDGHALGNTISETADAPAWAHSSSKYTAFETANRPGSTSLDDESGNQGLKFERRWRSVVQVREGFWHALRRALLSHKIRRGYSEAAPGCNAVRGSRGMTSGCSGQPRNIRRSLLAGVPGCAMWKTVCKNLLGGPHRSS